MTEITKERAHIDLTESGVAQPSYLRLAGWLGVIATIAFLVTIVAAQLWAVSNPDGPGEMAPFLDEMSDLGASAYVYGIAGVVLVFLYIPMSVGLYRLFSRTTLMWYGTASVVLGLLVLLPAYLINLLVPAGLVGLAEEVGGEALFASYSSAATMAELFFTVGSILSLGVGPLLWGLGWLRSTESSRWLAWVGVLVGVTGAVWFFWLVDSGLVGILLIVNVLASLIFFAGASVILLRRGGDDRRLG